MGLFSFAWPIIDANYRDGACQVGFTLYGIASDYNFIELLAVIVQHHFHIVGSRRGSRLEADIRNGELAACRYINNKLSIDVGHHTIACAFLHDSSTDNRLASSVYHHSGDAASLLGLCCQTIPTCHRPKYKLKSLVHVTLV